MEVLYAEKTARQAMEMLKKTPGLKCCNGVMMPANGRVLNNPRIGRWNKFQGEAAHYFRHRQGHESDRENVGCRRFRLTITKPLNMDQAFALY